MASAIWAASLHLVMAPAKDGEFDEALAKADKANSGVYIEVVTDTYAATPLSLKLHQGIATLYQSFCVRTETRAFLATADSLGQTCEVPGQATLA